MSNAPDSTSEKLADLRDRIVYFQYEIKRLETARAAGEPTSLSALADIQKRLAQAQKEQAKLQSQSQPQPNPSDTLKRFASQGFPNVPQGGKSASSPEQSDTYPLKSEHLPARAGRGGNEGPPGGGGGGPPVPPGKGPPGWLPQLIGGNKPVPFSPETKLAAMLGAPDGGSGAGVGSAAAGGPAGSVIQAVMGRISAISDKTGDVLGSHDRGDKRASSAFGLGSELADLSPGSVVKGFTDLGGAVFKSIEKLRDWTDGLHKSNMQFAEFSASMASVSAETEMRRVRFSQRRGDARAETARDLSEARDRLSRGFAPFEDVMKNFMNFIGSNALNKVAAALEFIARKMGMPKDKDEGTVGGLYTNIREAGGREWTANYGRPYNLP